MRTVLTTGRLALGVGVAGSGAAWRAKGGRSMRDTDDGAAEERWDPLPGTELQH